MNYLLAPPPTVPNEQNTPNTPAISTPAEPFLNYFVAPPLTAAQAAQWTAPRRSRRGLVLALILGVALLGTGGALAYFLVELSAANARIADQEQQLQKQKDLIDQKQTFGAEMKGLLDTAERFDGVAVSSAVPAKEIQTVADLAWYHRWNPDALAADIAAAHTETETLEASLAAASLEATTNTTGSTYEAVIDRLGAGFATTVIDNADALCDADVLACVVSNAPTTVHVDAADSTRPYMTDFLKTGIAYHEFAHVLQLANPVATGTALKAFDGDTETMADCFALTYLDGWKLNHRIFVSRYEYWDVSIGYGYTCNDDQKQTVRTWFDSLAYHVMPVHQAP